MSQLTLNADTSGFVTLSVAATVTSYTFQLPSAVPAANNSFLSSTNAGITSWTAASSAYATLVGYTTTVTSASPVTLTSSSTFYQFFTGSTAQTVVLPVTSTLATGWTFNIVNNSTANITVNSSGSNLVATCLPGTTLRLVCILTSGTAAASWDFEVVGFTNVTGTGNVVLATSPTLTTPAITGSSSGTTTIASANASATSYTATLPAENFTIGYLNIPQNSQSGAYQLALTDVGKHISISTGGVTVPISVFSPGDVVTIYNNSSSNQTITQASGATMYLAGTATTGNRTLAQRGIATVLCIVGGATPTFVVSGGGVT